MSGDVEKAISVAVGEAAPEISIDTAKRIVMAVLQALDALGLDDDFGAEDD